MPAVSSYTKYLPAVLWQGDPAPNLFSIGTMLCVFEKMLTGINDGVVISHGNNSVLTIVTQSVAGSPLPQTVSITPGSGTALLAGRSYTYDGSVSEVITITAVNANTLTAVIRQNHAMNGAILNSSGVHPPIQNVIANLVSLYGAWTAPADFLDWLAQWVALQLDPAWDEYQRRSAIANIVEIYAQRGTKPGLYEFFDLYALAKRRPRLVIDDAGKVLFAAPQPGLIVPVSTLVSQMPLVAPQCIALDASGFLFIGDLGNSSTIEPALWRLSPAGSVDYAAGAGVVSGILPPAPAPQPFTPATLALSAPIAVAADPVNGGAYLIDLTTDYVLYRLTSPQVGTITLAGTPTTGEAVTVVVDGTSYSLAQSTGDSLAQEATAWAVALNAAQPFNAGYAATASGDSIVVTPIAGPPGNDLTLVTASTHLSLSASGPCFGTAQTFANDLSVPPLGLVFPVALTVDGTGHPLILDRGAVVTSPSVTAIVAVQIAGTPPAYTGTQRHPLPAIVEPLSLLLRADGSIVVGDAADQSAAAPATLYEINPTTWTATNLLAGVAAADNPLVAPTGIVEVDARHLMVLDAGLRPYRPSAASPFTAVVAQQPAVYSVDLSVAPPVIALVTEQRSLVYPRGMVGDADGTLYICDSGLPDLEGYDSRKWRSLPQQFSVVVHFQGDPAAAVFSVSLAGTPTTGQQGIVTIGTVGYPLPETTGFSPAQQAAAWVSVLNASASFSVLYVAGSVGNIINIYAVPGTSANGVSLAVASSTDLQLSAGLLAATVTLTGTPTAAEHGVLNIGGAAYVLAETGGDSTAQQAAVWAATLNGTPAFAAQYVATASDNTLAISFVDASIAGSSPFFVSSSPHLTLTGTTPPLSIGSITLFGIPTTGESGLITVGTAPPYTLAQTTGYTVAQQAAAWCMTLNATAPFDAAFSCNSSGGVINIFATTTAVPPTGVVIAAVSSAHLQLTVYSELQNRSQFLQSITEVVEDELPAQARWYLQSEQSQL